MLFASSCVPTRAQVSLTVTDTRHEHDLNILSLQDVPASSSHAPLRKRSLEFWYCSPSYPYYYYYCPNVTAFNVMSNALITGEYNLLMHSLSFYGIGPFQMYVANGLETGAYPVIKQIFPDFPPGNSILSQPGLFEVFVNTSFRVEYGSVSSTPSMNGDYTYDFYTVFRSTSLQTLFSVEDVASGRFSNDFMFYTVMDVFPGSFTYKISADRKEVALLAWESTYSSFGYEIRARTCTGTIGVYVDNESLDPSLLGNGTLSGRLEPFTSSPFTSNLTTGTPSSLSKNVVTFANEI